MAFDSESYEIAVPFLPHPQGWSVSTAGDASQWGDRPVALVRYGRAGSRPVLGLGKELHMARERVDVRGSRWLSVGPSSAPIWPSTQRTARSGVSS